MGKRVVITSIGTVSSLGTNESEIISNFRNDTVSFEASPIDKNILTAPIKNFRLKDIIGSFKNSKYLHRGAQLCTAAAYAAVAQSKLSKETLSQTGLLIASAPNLDFDIEFPEIQSGKITWEGENALWMLNFLPNTVLSVISQITGIHGENFSINTACTSSLQSIGEAYRKIKDGYITTALAGGGDSRLGTGGLIAYKSAQALHSGFDDPLHEYAPFDVSRKGFVPGEGGACFILEELDQAISRNVFIYGEICGYGNSVDGYNMTAPEPTAKYAQAAVDRAFAEQDFNKKNLDLVCAHGTGTILNDESETLLIERFYATTKVTAFKSWFGHLATSCGSNELASALICMKNNFLPKIRNLQTPCSQKINFIRKSMNKSFDSFVLHNFGFGGHNAVMIIKKFTGQ